MSIHERWPSTGEPKFRVARWAVVEPLLEEVPPRGKTTPHAVRRTVEARAIAEFG